PPISSKRFVFICSCCAPIMPATKISQEKISQESTTDQPREAAVTIAIIGTGNVGSALARGWSRAGQRVVLGARDVSAPKVTTLARETRADAKPPAEAAAAADVVVLALPWQVAEGAVKALGGLKDKVVIDCMNPLSMQDGKLGLDRGFATSGAETLS